MKENSPVFSTAYLPPVSWIKKVLQSENVCLDAHEHFVKQTYRNRCEIYGPNGVQTLTIPVDHTDLYSKPIKDVRINYDSRWKIIHLRSIQTAYGNAPYYEHFADEFQNLYSSTNETFLFDFNLKALETIFTIIRKQIHFSFTEKYLPEYPEDFRIEFNPKAKKETPSYYQIFSDRYGFKQDLSIIDLLFNEGRI